MAYDVSNGNVIPTDNRKMNDVIDERYQFECVINNKAFINIGKILKSG
jgi:hypothetical protein